MMSSEATHARKSRLTIPSGADPLTPPPPPAVTSSTMTPSSASSSATGASAGRAGGSAAHSVSGLPNHNMNSHHHPHHHSNNNNTPVQYLQRLLDVRQMDIQSALDQMKTILSTRPAVVYKTSYYRKQTKNHWARDDPAFGALQAVFLMIASTAYAVAFRTSLWGAVSFLLYTVLWNWLAMGILLATACREIANRHLTVQASSSHVKQQVEWLYAFDIHCNAFFPVFVVLYGAQFFLLPLVLQEGLIPFLVANTLYAGALTWYWYITHLGYRALPFLTHTEVFLFPIAAILLVYGVLLGGYPFGLGWNMSRVMARFYFM